MLQDEVIFKLVSKLIRYCPSFASLRSMSASSNSRQKILRVSTTSVLHAGLAWPFNMIYRTFTDLKETKGSKQEWKKRVKVFIRHSWKTTVPRVSSLEGFHCTFAPSIFMTSVHPPPPQSPSSPSMEQYTDRYLFPSLRLYALFGLALMREHQSVIFFESYEVVLWNVTRRKKEAALRDIAKNTRGSLGSALLRSARIILR